jgi:hypothetical protein
MVKLSCLVSQILSLDLRSSNSYRLLQLSLKPERFTCSNNRITIGVGRPCGSKKTLYGLEHILAMLIYYPMHCNHIVPKNSKQIFSEIKLCGLVPNFYIHVSATAK